MKIFDDGEGFTVTIVREPGIPVTLARFQFPKVYALSPGVYAASALMDRQFTDITAEQCMQLASALLGFVNSQISADPLTTPILREMLELLSRHANK